MLDFKTASTIATSIAHSKLVSNATPSFSTSNPSKLSVCSLFKTCLHRLLPERPGITISLVPILKSLRWLKIPERIHFRVMLLTYNSLQYSNHPANPFSRQFSCLSPSLPRSLVISYSQTEPCPSLHFVFGMICHLKSALFLLLQCHHCQSTIFIRVPLSQCFPTCVPRR